LSCTLIFAIYESSIFGKKLNFSFFDLNSGNQSDHRTPPVPRRALCIGRGCLERLAFSHPLSCGRLLMISKPSVSDFRLSEIDNTVLPARYYQGLRPARSAGRILPGGVMSFPSFNGFLK